VPKRKKTTTSRAPKGRRFVLIALAIAGAIALLLAAGGSIALHRILTTGKLREWANGEPEKLRLEYSSASGWVPWDIRVRNLELRSRDSNVEWYFRMDEVRLSFSPLELLTHRIHITRVRARGLSFRLRERLVRAEASAAHVAALPEIPGFPSPPLKAPDEKAPPEEGHPFSISVTGLDVENVREVWIDIWRLAGPSATGRLVGSFDLLPRRRATVGPARLEMSGVALTLGPHTVATSAKFETDATIRTFDARQVRGDDVWPYITGHAGLSGRLAGLEFVNHFLGSSPEPRLSGGAGSLAMDITVENGKGRGTLTSTSSHTTARYHDATIRADVSLRGRIPGWDFQHDRIDLSGTRVSLDHVMAGEPGPDSRDWWGHFDLSNASIQPGRPAAFRTGVVAKCRDARPPFTLFDVGLPGWARGVLKLEGLDAKATIGLGTDVVDLDGLDATGGAFRIRGDLHDHTHTPSPSSSHAKATTGTKEGAFLLESKLLSVGIEMDTAGTKLKLAGAKEWFESRRRTAATSR